MLSIKEKGVRTFTSSQTSYTYPGCAHGDIFLNNVYCTGMKIDISSISLTYNCQY